MTMKLPFLSGPKMYAENEIKALSFWRIGQEDEAYWKHLKIKETEENK